MEIELHRAYHPSEAQTTVSCAVCQREFELGVVFAWVLTDGGPDQLCDSCLMHYIEWQHSTLEQYNEALARYTTPYFATEADYERAVEEGRADDHYEVCYLT